MPNIIKIKRGNISTLPALNVGEMAYVFDQETLFIGTPDGNKRINSSGYVEAFKYRGLVVFEDDVNNTPDDSESEEEE